MKNEYSYSTCEEARDALKNCLLQDFRWGSEHEVDFWIREFVRGSVDDMYWMTTAINMIGVEDCTIHKWFFIQVKYPEIWTKESHSMITELARFFDELYQAESIN